MSAWAKLIVIALVGGVGVAIVAYGATRQRSHLRFSSVLEAKCPQTGTLDALVLCDSPVVDASEVLPDDLERRLAKTLASAERDTGSQIVVVTVPSLEGKDPKQAALVLAEHWKLGGDSADGAILLVATGDMKVRLQYGRGFKPKMTDARALAVIRAEFIPFAKGGDIPRAIIGTAQRVVEERQGNR